MSRAPASKDPFLLARACLALACLAACGTTVTTARLNGAPGERPARPPASVEMFTTGVPPRPYTEVALIEARQQAYSADSTSDVLDDLRAQAGLMGCDGLVLLGAADATVGSVASTGTAAGGFVSGDVRTLHGYRGTCVVWTQPADPTKPAPPPADPRCAPACGPGLKCWGGVCAASQ